MTDTIIIVLILGFALSIVVGVISQENGHNFLVGFILSLIFSPLIGILIVIANGKNIEGIKNKHIKQKLLKRCSSCMETIQIRATICPYCKTDVRATPLGLCGENTLGRSPSTCDAQVPKTDQTTIKSRYICTCCHQRIDISELSTGIYSCPKCKSEFNV